MLSPRTIAGIHATYYVVTGVWSVAHRSSFERVSGPKRDYWLVRLVGGLALAIGAGLGTTVVAGRKSREAQVLALAAGSAFVAGDLYAATASSRAYLGDAALHVVLLPAWLKRWS